jgi:hypothetical protein
VLAGFLFAYAGAAICCTASSAYLHNQHTKFHRKRLGIEGARGK